MLVKNEIPILEYDDGKEAVVMPRHENLPISLPERAVFAFLGDAVDFYAEKSGAKVVGYFESATKNYPIYVLGKGEKEVCLAQAPVGAAAATQILDWLFAYGVKKVISAGCCGVLEDFAENEFLVPTRALRDEGTSYHYAPPSRFIEVQDEALDAIKAALDAHDVPYREVITWTTDGFFRETKEKVAYRKEEGCSVVEMECSALAACAQFRKKVFGQILYAGDTLADADEYDARDWGKSFRDEALELSFDAVLRL